jgi:hypothetical protein
MTAARSHSYGHYLAAGVAIVFGALTIFSGGSVLFGGEKAQQAAGNIVGFVLIFNFLAGFLYVLAGIGLLWRKRWASWLAAAILTATLVVFAAFGIHVMQGGTFEMRTLGAMTLRTVVWAVIAWVALN